MDLLLPIQINGPEERIGYSDEILLTGSCFTEHIGEHLQDLKFRVLQNPHGILFDAYSVAGSLRSYVKPREYSEKDLIHFNELWQSWEHHSRFSHIDQRECLLGINASQQAAHKQLKNARWLIITLGSSFSYRLTREAVLSTKGGLEDMPVANCHRAPAAWFRKHLMDTEEIVREMAQALQEVWVLNPGLQVLLTVSPVRHIRDGVIANNRSKARLIEAVHRLVESDPRIYYFPSYELVIDVLRDYRFYDIDLVHPNFAATRYVMEQFMQHFVSEEAVRLSGEVQQIVHARKHRPFQPLTNAHKRFLNTFLEKARHLQSRCPYLDLQEEIRYFAKGSEGA
jgi:hypothetical protein